MLLSAKRCSLIAALIAFALSMTTLRLECCVLLLVTLGELFTRSVPEIFEKSLREFNKTFSVQGSQLARQVACPTRTVGPAGLRARGIDRGRVLTAPVCACRPLDARGCWLPSASFSTSWRRGRSEDHGEPAPPADARTHVPAFVPLRLPAGALTAVCACAFAGVGCPWVVFWRAPA